MATCRNRILLLVVLIGPATAWSQAPPSPTDETPSKPVEFAPGIQIDWQNATVWLEAKIVLRNGPLELLACSPQTREHESILSVSARPLHIFQAMGMIGLEPGSPVFFDAQTERWRPPNGHPLRVQVRCQNQSLPTNTPSEQWMIHTRTDRPPQRLDWVFAGSRTLDEGRFLADLDGTVLCVVDFDSALITLAALHSADNEQLWVRANTEAIPPIGTKCHILVSEEPSRLIEVRIERDGSLQMAKAKVSAEEIAARYRKVRSDAGAPTLILRSAEEASESKIAESLRALAAAGIDEAAILVPRPLTSKPPAGPNHQPGRGVEQPGSLEDNPKP